MGPKARPMKPLETQQSSAAALRRYQDCQLSTFTFSVGLSSQCSDKMIGAVVHHGFVLFCFFSPRPASFFLIVCKRCLEKFTWVYTFYSRGREGGEQQCIAILLCNHFSVTSSSHRQCCTAFCLIIQRRLFGVRPESRCGD